MIQGIPLAIDHLGQSSAIRTDKGREGLCSNHADMSASDQRGIEFRRDL